VKTGKQASDKCHIRKWFSKDELANIGWARETEGQTIVIEAEEITRHPESYSWARNSGHRTFRHGQGEGQAEARLKLSSNYHLAEGVSALVTFY